MKVVVATCFTKMQTFEKAENFLVGTDLLRLK